MVTRVRALTYGLATAALVGLGGCATMEEMDALRTQVNASTTSMKRQIDSLQRQLRAQEQKVNNHDSQLQDVKTSVTTASERQRMWDQELEHLRAAIHDKDNALQSVLSAQEAVYRDGIRTLQSIRSRIGGHSVLTDSRTP